MLEKRPPAETYKVIFGGNFFKNVRSVITWNGKDAILRFRDGGDMKLLVDCTVSDPYGNTIIKLANGKIQYVADFLDSSNSENGIVVKDKISGNIYLEFTQLGEREVKINGIFHIKGHKIEATDGGVIIDTIRISHNYFDGGGTGKGISLSPGRIALG